MSLPITAETSPWPRPGFNPAARACTVLLSKSIARAIEGVERDPNPGQKLRLQTVPLPTQHFPLSLGRPRRIVRLVFRRYIINDVRALLIDTNAGCSHGKLFRSLRLVFVRFRNNNDNKKARKIS